MPHFAYLRVSTDQQDTQNQKLGILDYCNNRSIGPLKFIEDTASGKIHWQDREIGKIIKEAREGDNLIVSEVSRLGRSTLQVLEILEKAAEKKISVHIAKNNLLIDGSMQSTIVTTILGLAAQIEREFISLRTKEALSQRKAQGIQLGRPKGPSTVLRLDSYKEEILGYIKKDISKRSIAKLIECSPSTLYYWLKRRRIPLK
jgi:DNA invertase Pin-like site-specific DNA recombinase